jgi:hypothetical protein
MNLGAPNTTPTTEPKPTTEPTPKPRYTVPRVHLRWNKNDRLRVLKMLAWAVYYRGIRNPAALEQRVEATCESVMATALGKVGVTLDVIRAQTLAEQGVPITTAKLHQRADKADRYGELNNYWRPVLDAYDELNPRT